MPKRRLEFLAGRYCVREALRAIGHDDTGPIGIGPDRSPRWPPGIVGTITHTSRYASAAVARATDARGLGLDVQPMIADDVADRVRDLIAAPEELEALASTGWNMSVLLTAVFSAKEAVFKCLYAQVGRYFDFRDAAVTSIDVIGRISVVLHSTLTAELHAGYELHGRFERDESRFATAMVLAQ